LKKTVYREAKRTAAAAGINEPPLLLEILSRFLLDFFLLFLLVEILSSFLLEILSSLKPN
jgi:hypothetical protein